MLRRLLHLLEEGETRRVDDLARALDTSPALVEAMLETLSRQGYLAPGGQTCSTACEKCPLAGKCAAGMGGSTQVWVWKEGG